MHFFHIGQFDVIVMLHTGYGKKPVLRDVVTVVHFDAPSSYNAYKENAQIIGDEQGAVITMVLVPSPDDVNILDLLQRKFVKNFGNPNMLLCLPLIWTELVRSKSRVEGVIAALSNKAVAQQKVLEFKKQLVSNKSLKQYFKENPQEKEILLNDIQKAHSKNDRHLFKSLEVMPSYVIPHSIIAVTPQEVSQCTVGCQSMSGANPDTHLITAATALLGQAPTFVDLDNASHLITNLVDYPAAVNR
jgi:hypothetical protein